MMITNVEMTDDYNEDDYFWIAIVNFVNQKKLLKAPMILLG